jgi:hypothetical protein
MMTILKNVKKYFSLIKWVCELNIKLMLKFKVPIFLFKKITKAWNKIDLNVIERKLYIWIKKLAKK